MISPSTPVGLRLRVSQGGRRLFARVMYGDLIKIGRNSSCDVVLEGTGVCRIHAIIERELGGTGYSITHFGAGGSTLLNGAPVSRAGLQSGDELHIGEFQIGVQETIEKQADGLAVDERDIVLITTPDDQLVPAPVAKVLWSATADEMSEEPVTGEVFISDLGGVPHPEPIVLLTKMKSAPPLAPRGPVQRSVARAQPIALTHRRRP